LQAAAQQRHCCQRAHWLRTSGAEPGWHRGSGSGSLQGAKVEQGCAHGVFGAVCVSGAITRMHCSFAGLLFWKSGSSAVLSQMSFITLIQQLMPPSNTSSVYDALLQRYSGLGTLVLYAMQACTLAGQH
jgi:hypothetical protein